MEEVKKEEQKKEEGGLTKNKKEKNILMAALCYFGFLVLIPLLTDAKKEPYVKFHIKQGLVLFIAGVINSMIFMIPILGWFAGFVIWIILLVLFIIGLINALNGKESQLPIIGKYGKKIKI